MSGLFNTYFYGKAGQGDYTVEQMPKNRLELFFTALKGQFGKLCQLNLLYDLFCLPMFFWVYLNYQLLNTYAADTGSIAGFVQDGYLSSFLIGMVPCLIIMGLGSAGQMYPLRNWARDQHSFMLSDFKDSLKTNWKQGLVLGLINGISLPVLFVCTYYYGAMAESNVLFVVPQVLVYVLVSIWWAMNMIAFPMVVTYEMRLRDILRNCMLIVIARLPWSVLFLATTLVGPILGMFFLPNMLWLLGVLFVYIVVGFSLTGLVYASFANACFDRYLNPRIAGAKVGQGMRDPSLDFSDDADEDEIRREIEKIK